MSGRQNYKRIRPDVFEDLAFCNKVAAPTYQKSEYLKSLFGKSIHGEAVNAIDRALLEIEAKTLEFVYLPFFQRVRLRINKKQEGFRKMEELRKDLSTGFPAKCSCYT